MNIEETDALIVVDVQNDFGPGGALPVNEGNKIVNIINRVALRFEHLAFTRDWHPSDHCSFSDDAQFVDKSWPPHCVANSPGAEFQADLHVPGGALVVDKGFEAEHEAYSGFEGTNLDEELNTRGIRRVFVCGLATDFCVKCTALDGRKLDYDVVLVEDACRAIDSPPGSAQEALDEMKAAGVVFCQSRDLVE